jgi:hypothetical protein
MAMKRRWPRVGIAFMKYPTWQHDEIRYRSSISVSFSLFFKGELEEVVVASTGSSRSGNRGDLLRLLFQAA